MMLNKAQIESTIVALQNALEYNVNAILAAHGAGNTSVHRVLSQTPALSFTLTALSQMQDLLADIEVAEDVLGTADEDGEPVATVENAFAQRMREARERKAAKKR
jgi:hypothetical protein